MDHNTSMEAEQLFNPLDMNELDFLELLMPYSQIKMVYKIIWYTIGMPLNVLAFIVWIQSKMRHSSGCYLAALAVSDFMFLFLNMLDLLEVHETVASCQLIKVLYYWTMYPSTLLVLSFTIEQYIAICYPMKRSLYCQSKTAMKIIVVIFLFSLALSGVQGYFFYYDDYYEVCTVRDSILQMIWPVWTNVTEALIFYLLPLIMLVLNVLVIRSVRQQSRKMSQYKQATNEQQNRTTTIMLLVISFYWIFTTPPASVVYTMNAAYVRPDRNLTIEQIFTDPECKSYTNYHIATLCINAICMSRFALNFCLYCLTGKRFRKQLLTIFRCYKKRPCDSSQSMDTYCEYHTVANGKSDVYVKSHSNGHLSLLAPHLANTWGCRGVRANSVGAQDRRDKYKYEPANHLSPNIKICRAKSDSEIRPSPVHKNNNKYVTVRIIEP